MPFQHILKKPYFFSLSTELGFYPLHIFSQSLKNFQWSITPHSVSFLPCPCIILHSSSSILSSFDHLNPRYVVDSHYEVIKSSFFFRNKSFNQTKMLHFTTMISVLICTLPETLNASLTQPHFYFILFFCIFFFLRSKVLLISIRNLHNLCFSHNSWLFFLSYWENNYHQTWNFWTTFTIPKRHHYFHLFLSPFLWILFSETQQTFSWALTVSQSIYWVLGYKD